MGLGGVHVLGPAQGVLKMVKCRFGSKNGCFWLIFRPKIVNCHKNGQKLNKKTGGPQS